VVFSDRNDTDGTLLGLQAEARPSAALVAPAVKYQTLMELGRGGSAVVSAALARGIGGFSKLVVLKTIKEELCAHPDAVRSSLNEARLAARMSHPNVVQVYEVYQEHGVPVIVMEYLDGLSLSRVARQGQAGRQTLRVMLSILCKVLEGIRYAHGLSDFDGKPLGIVHRDISPQNVMLTYDGQVKLVDFGTAKLMAGATEPLSGMFRGKLVYMPPEQVCGEVIDGRVDLFAVGVMLWEAVAGRRLWGDLHHAGIIRRLLEHDIPQLADVAPEVDPELERICSRALQPEREQRYPDASAFLRDLESYLATLGGNVSALALGEMVQHSCADLKRAREESLRAALAQLPDWQFGEQPEPAATLLPVDSTLELAPLTERGVRRRRHTAWVGLLAACLLVGVFLARQSPSSSASTAMVASSASSAAALPASVMLAAPSAVVLAAPSAVVLAAPSAAVREPLLAHDAVERALPEATVTEVTALDVMAEEPVPLPARARKASKSPRRAAAPAVTRRTTKPTQSTAALPAPCDPPYVIDAHGIKRFRRECLSATP
jgi:eukaryotic-like serine/threonine-protein kinase